MDNALSTAEHEVVKPYLIELYEQGIEKGLEKGREEGREKGKEEAMKYLILTFLKKNPTWTN